MTHSPSGLISAHFVIHFQSLLREGRAILIPCDASGRVDIDELGARAKVNYLFARAMIGRDYAPPIVQPT